MHEKSLYLPTLHRSNNFKTGDSPIKNLLTREPNNQCDQMVRYIFQYLNICNNENLNDSQKGFLNFNNEVRQQYYRNNELLVGKHIWP